MTQDADRTFGIDGEDGTDILVVEVLNHAQMSVASSDVECIHIGIVVEQGIILTSHVEDFCRNLILLVLLIKRFLVEHIDVLNLVLICQIKGQGQADA